MPPLISDENPIHPISPDALLHINFQFGDPLSLNPGRAADMPCHILANLLFEGLTSISPTGNVQPAVAEKVHISECGTIYTFRLKDAWWSNGEKLTASHFEKTWKKALMLHHECPHPDFFFLIKNAQKVREKKANLKDVGIEVKEAKILRVILENPCPYFLDLLSTPPFFPILEVENEEPLHFNGPFKVLEWKRNAGLHLRQNPFYHEAQLIKLGGINISMIRDPYIAYEMFQKRELDFIGDPITPLPPEILKQRDVQQQLIHKQISRIFWIHCNLRRFPLRNVNIRRALSLALNRKQITEKVLIKQIPQLSPLPYKYASFQGYETGDPSLARAYFEKALKELACDRKTFPTLVITHSDLSFEKPLFEELRAQWKEVLGIDVSAQNLRWNEFSAAIEKGNFQLCGLFRRDLFNNALSYLSFFKSKPSNPYSLENKEYTRLLKLFECEDKSKETLEQIETLLINETPVIPLVNQKFLALIAPQVKGIKWDENGCLFLKEVFLDNNH